MDPRVREHAEIICDWSIELEADEDVVVTAAPEAHDLVVALNEEIGRRGGNVVTLYSSDEAGRAYLKAHDGDFTMPEHVLALYEEADAAVHVRSDANVTEMSDVDGETMAERSRVTKPITEERLSTNWCLTQHPTRSYAQNAGMSTDEYRGFVYEATLRDWQEVHDRQEELRRRLDEASEVRVVGDDTDVSMDVDGMNAVNSSGKNNLPSGEVFTAPVPDSVEGEVLFDKPLIHQGKEMEGVYLEFNEGVVVESSAESNEEALDDLLETDDGARRLGELGIGTNRDIDRFTYNMLFDEKMGDTVHMALGRAYDENVGEDREGNDSAVHVDMIKDVSDGRIEFDGDVVQEGGEFVWE